MNALNCFFDLALLLKHTARRTLERVILYSWHLCQLENTVNCRMPRGTEYFDLHFSFAMYQPFYKEILMQVHLVSPRQSCHLLILSYMIYVQQP